MVAFIRAWTKTCSSTLKETILVIPAGKKYTLKPITFRGPCKSPITLNINGNISASKNLEDYRKNTRYWLSFENVNDLSVGGGGTIDGNGRVWWPKHCKKDKTRALTFEGCKNLIVSNLLFKNPQRMHLTVDDSKNVQISNVKIIAPKDSPNTDGIHVSGSTNVVIKNSVISTGDDCISIVSGSHQIVATDIFCGPGHGISIGSLGKNGVKDDVSNIKVSGVIISGADNGVRIKSWQGGKGVAENIIFESIRMMQVKNPIIIDQFYCDKKGVCPEKKDAVKIRNVLFKDIKGLSASERGITLNCSSSVPCEGIRLEDIKLIYKNGSSMAYCSSAKVSQRGTMSPHC
ncbi:hypothetical protein M9H77_02335 [Catharanthus roseus]|uniref:Uncharacterized protein n=1 Tax=Catharanthus roseus TaxID=4058 RepID=A0ACC0C8I4_CATRO|nr:hypothetical protein M9H77_02335 [Catharanthus roseus]